MSGSMLHLFETAEERQSEAKRLGAIEDAVQATQDGFLVLDAAGHFLFANAAWLQNIWRSVKPPTSSAHVRSILHSVIVRGVFVVPEALSRDDFCTKLFEMIAGQAKDVEIATGDGHTLSLSVNQTPRGGHLLLFRDVTASLRAEHERIREREISHHDEKLSALGDLLANIAHELNNPLSVVYGFAQMLEGQVTDPAVAERLALVRHSAERAANIVKTFSAMAQHEPSQSAPFSLNNAVEAALRSSRGRLLANRTRVHVELDGALPEVLGEQELFVQVFVHLIENAVHALRPLADEGVLTLRSFQDASAGRVVVEVCDNGPGIPTEIQRRILEPLFTTKSVGEGRGAGLSICHRVVKSYGGALDLVSNRGQGTSVFVRLDALTPEGSGAATEVCRTVVNPTTVLLLGVEPCFTQFVADLLTEEGFIVTISLTPYEAPARPDCETYDVVVRELAAPLPGGEDGLGGLKALAPESANRTGYIIGDVLGADALHVLEETGSPYIEKPVIREELLKLVHDIVAERKLTDPW